MLLWYFTCVNLSTTQQLFPNTNAFPNAPPNDPPYCQLVVAVQRHRWLSIISIQRSKTRPHHHKPKIGELTMSVLQSALMSTVSVIHVSEPHHVLNCLICPFSKITAPHFCVPLTIFCIQVFFMLRRNYRRKKFAFTKTPADLKTNKKHFSHSFLHLNVCFPRFFFPMSWLWMELQSSETVKKQRIIVTK